MYLDLPQFTRCCFCMPLRRGVLTFAYLNLIFTVVSMSATSYAISVGRGDNVVMMYRGHTIITSAVILIAVYVIDAVFDIVLIVGAHKKDVRLLNIFYYYGITTTIAVFVVNIFLTWSTMWFIEELFIIFSGTVFQGYLLLLVRSEMAKLQQQTAKPVQFFNKLTDVVVGDPLSSTADIRTLVDEN